MKASPKCSSRVPDRSSQHTACCGKPKPVKWAIAQTCLSVLQRYFWIKGYTYAKATKGEVISLLSTVLWSRTPFQIHGSSAFTYMRNELTISLTKDVPKTPRTLEKDPFFPDFLSLIWQPPPSPLWGHPFHMFLSFQAVFQKEILFPVVAYAIHPPQPVYAGKVIASRRPHLWQALHSQRWGLDFHSLS